VTRAQDQTPQGDRPPGLGTGPVVRAAAYVALFLLGAVQALIGTFQYGRGPGSLLAICFAIVILATCVLGAWGMRTGAGGVLPAAGWYLVAIVLGTSSTGGSVLVTDSSAGKWFLFGGAVGAAAGALIAFGRWSRARAARRSGLTGPRPDHVRGRPGQAQRGSRQTSRRPPGT
jgi:hypothetical protein